MDHPPCEGMDDIFVQLLNQYKKPLFRLIHAMVRSPSDAEDLFQQTAITMWDKFDQFEVGTNFFAWGSMIARNKVRDFIKASARRRVYFSEEVIDKLAAEELHREVEDARLLALSSCRGKLWDSDQHLLADCYAGGETIAQVAERTGRTPSSLYSNLWRVRRALYDCIQRTLAREGFA